MIGANLVTVAILVERGCRAAGRAAARPYRTSVTVKAHPNVLPAQKEKAGFGRTESRLKATARISSDFDHHRRRRRRRRRHGTHGDRRRRRRRRRDALHAGGQC